MIVRDKFTFARFAAGARDVLAFGGPCDADAVLIAAGFPTLPDTAGITESLDRVADALVSEYYEARARGYRIPRSARPGIAAALRRIRYVARREEAIR